MVLLLSTSSLYFVLGNISYMAYFYYLVSLDQQNNLIKLVATKLFAQGSFLPDIFWCINGERCDVLPDLVPFIQF